MKSPTTLTGTDSSWNQLFNRFKFTFSASLALVLGLCLSCNPKIADVLNPDVEQSTPEIHVAFAGGGWRAHTGHSAWIMSLLQANSGGCTLVDPAGNPNCLDAAFTNVKTISGNSGGSWFSSMLMYDEVFINQITSKYAVRDWSQFNPQTPNDGGWLGRQKYYFQSFGSCSSETGDKYLACVLAEYYNSCNNTLVPDWSLLTSDLVYKGYNWQAYGNMNTNTHQPWAQDKSLLMAATLVTNSVVLNDNGSGDDEIYYQVCNVNETVHLDKDKGGKCLDSQGRQVTMPDVVPASFTSLAATDPSLIPLPFFSALTPGYNLGYSVAYLTGSPPAKLSKVSAPFSKANNIPVMWAAAASSAATGYTASHRITSAKCSLWDCAYHARNLSLGFSFPDYSNGEIMLASSSSIDVMNFNQLLNQRVMRVADGGIVDNSGIPQLIQFLQRNRKVDGFKIVAFDDVYENDSSDPTKYPSSDISYLFKSPTGNQITYDGVTIEVPPLAILKESTGTPVAQYTWTVTDGTGHSNTLHYYIYRVETITNNNFTIAGGHKGTIHVFSSKYPKAATGPDNLLAFSAYENMIKYFPTTLAKRPDGVTTGPTGLEMLKAAFGL